MIASSRECVCNLCGALEGEVLRRGVYGGPAQNVHRCGSCGHVYLAPLMDDACEERFYLEEYPAFLSRRGDPGIRTPEEHFRQGETEAIRRHRLIADLLAPEYRVLEIGSSTGYFLHHIRRKVKEVVGVEPNQNQREYANARGITTHADLVGLGGEGFDVVFLYYVLEHVKDPVAFLRGIAKQLRTHGARIVIEVPNVHEALVDLYASPAYDAFVWQRAHVSYFSIETLGRALASAGLSSEFRPVQRYDLSNHLHWLAAGKPGGTGKYRPILSDALDVEYRRCLEERWLCDTILAVAQLAIV